MEAIHVAKHILALEAFCLHGRAVLQTQEAFHRFLRHPQ